jgi:hypothetical protein
MNNAAPYRQRPKGVRLDPATREALGLLVERVGVDGAAAITMISAGSIRQALAGLPILYGTSIAIDAGLRAALSAMNAGAPLRLIPGGSES